LPEGTGSQGTEARRLLDRRELERVLEAVHTGEMSQDELLAWPATILAAQEFYVGETEDNGLIWDVVYGLEECSDPGREGEIVDCAVRYRKALLATPESHWAEALVCLAGGQASVLDRVGAYLDGTISRMDYEHAIKDRAPDWPPQLIEPMLRLSDEDLRKLAEALKRDSYGEVLRILQR
jgi:hypothetical protein